MFDHSCFWSTISCLVATVVISCLVRLQTLAYCDTVLCGASAMAGAIEMSHLALIETLGKGVTRIRPRPPPLQLACRASVAVPESPGDPTIDEW